jgi:hypothetical protein
MRALFALPIIVLGACSFSPSADVIKALAGDPNTICFTETSIYLSFSLDRNHGCGQAPATPASVVVVSPGTAAPSHVEVIRP